MMHIIESFLATKNHHDLDNDINEAKDEMKMEKSMSLNPRVGIGVLIINSKNEILLGKRLGSHGKSTWSFAGGHLEFGESFEDCVIRETFEETGLHITKPKFFAVTNDFFHEEAKHYVTIFFIVNLPEGQKVINKEPTKCEAWQWFELDNLPDNLFLPVQNLFKKHCYGKKEILIKEFL